MFGYYALILILTTRRSLASYPAVIQLTEPVDHAEGPVWDHRIESLYFVDIHSGGFHIYNPRSEEHSWIKLKGELSLIVPSESSTTEFVVGLNRSVVEIELNGGRNRLKSSRVLARVDSDKPRNRFNDGKADSKGRLWLGTMGYESPDGKIDPNKGSLYLITKENLAHPKPVISPVNISNGLTWNRANDRFYYIDTPTDQVREYHFDEDSGAISDPHVVFDLKDFRVNVTGHPDGMTIDTDDNLWIALYDGGAVIKVDPRRKALLRVVPIPARYTTSVCWGGPDYDVLYVTTSRFGLDVEERKRQSAAGSLFAVKGLGDRGLAMFNTNVGGSGDKNRNHIPSSYERY